VRLAVSSPYASRAIVRDAKVPARPRVMLWANLRVRVPYLKGWSRGKGSRSHRFVLGWGLGAKAPRSLLGERELPACPVAPFVDKRCRSGRLDGNAGHLHLA